MSEPQSKEWVRVKDAEEITAFLVERFRPDLKDVGFICLGKPKASRKNGVVNVAKIKVLTARDRIILLQSGEHADYSIEIGLDAWTFAKTRPLRMKPAGLPENADERYQHIHHEITHALPANPETGNSTLRPHDVQDFSEIIAMYGIIDYGQYQYVKAAKDVPLVEPAVRVEIL